MRENGIPQSRINQALLEIAEKYDVHKDKITPDNRPEWNERPAAVSEVEGQKILKYIDFFSTSLLGFWGPNVKEEHLRSYGWKPVEYVGTVHNGLVKECHSTENYPIFAQECNYTDDEGRLQTFHKIYQPRNFKKQYRFSYIGHVPKNYIYGLEALKCAFRKNGEKKLREVFLVSGGSDAVNCLSMGGQAVWLNSETADLTKQQYDKLHEYANRIYAIGDIDATGKERAKLLALQYPDIYNITLPEDLLYRFHDARGNRCKDLKDYVKIRPNREDFWMLVNQARKAQFWYASKDKNGNVTGYRISSTNLSYFLELNGYFTLYDNQKENPHYIHENGILVEDVYPKDIKTFLNHWSQENALPEMLQDVICRCKDLPSKEISNLHEHRLNFDLATSTTQHYFFRNCWVEVKADGIYKHTYREATLESTHIWGKNVIQHNYADHSPFFEIHRQEDGTYEASILPGADSDVLTYLHHSSRLYWRQSDEKGISLSEQQLRDEKQCLAAKLACIGYYLHQYRSASMSYAAILQDAYLAEDEQECNGRSGKSFMLEFLKQFIPTFSIDARDPKCAENNRFLFDGVTEYTGLVAIDECARTLPYSYFFGKITGPFTGQAKYGHPFVIPSEKAPKLIFATNYVIKDIDSSTQARLWPQIFGDYYHTQAQNNDYRETRTIHDDFGYNLIDSDYPEEKWQADIALAMQCLQFYLSLPVSDRKIMPPMGTILRRTQRAIMGGTFEDWAFDYYHTGSEHLDVTEDYDKVLQDYKIKTEDRMMSPKSFTRKLKEFCSFADHIQCYNPAELTETKEDGGRIREYQPGNSRNKVPKIHIRSEKWTNTPITQEGILPLLID